jgi:hypothetical protein
MQRNPTPAETANQPTPIGIPNNADVALPANYDTSPGSVGRRFPPASTYAVPDRSRRGARSPLLAPCAHTARARCSPGLKL